MDGNISETGDAGESPGKSSLFFLTDFQDLGIGLTGDKVLILAKQYLSVLSGALSTVLENPVERFTCTSGRTHNRLRSPRCAASSQ